MSATEQARRLIRAGVNSPQRIAYHTGLSVGYIQKLKQRDAGKDSGHKKWRRRNPDKIRIYRDRQNIARRQRNTVLGIARKPTPPWE